METTQDHSKGKLMLAVITSPGAAFEEILRRNLLGTGLWIAFAAGCLTMIGAALRAYPFGPVHFFSLGYANPFTWMGLLFLYALALHGLLKWLGTVTKFENMLLVMSWAQVTLLGAQALSAAEAALMLAPTPSPNVISMMDLLGNVFRLGYVLVVATGIRSASTAPFARGILGYVMVHFIAVVGLTFTYAKSRIGLFEGAPMGIAYAAQALVVDVKPPWVNDCTPLLGAAVVGMALGLWRLGKSLEWSNGTCVRRTVAAAAVGAALFGGYYYMLSSADYYGKLLSALRLHEREHFSDAADRLEKVVPMMPGEAVELTLDLGSFRFAAGEDKKAEAEFLTAIESVKTRAAANRKLFEAFARVGLGSVYDIGGKVPQAVSQFNRARKLWPEFREPWSRSVITLVRAGDYAGAIKDGEHAVKKLESKAPEMYVALVQAYAGTGKIDAARSSYKKLYDLDEEMAKRIGSDPKGWTDAVAKLTRADLRFPLERDFAYTAPPTQPKRPRSPLARKKAPKGSD